MVQIKQVGKAQGHAIDRLGLTQVNSGGGQGWSRLLVVASRSTSGQLVVQAWSVADNGTPTLTAGRVEGLVSEVAVHAVGKQRVVVAVRDDEGRLRLIAYSVSASGKTLKRLGTRVAGDVRRFAVTSSSDSSVTVARHHADQQASISSWTLDDSGEFGDEVTAPLGDGKVSAIDIAAGLHEFAFTAVTMTGTHRLRAFKGPSAAGGAGTGGKVRSVAIDTASAPDGYWTACIDKDSAAVRTGLNGLGGRLILDTGPFDVVHWEFENLSLQSPLRRGASGRVEGMAGIAWELDVWVSLSGLCFVVTRGADTYEKLLPKERGKPKLRLMAFECDAHSVRRVGQGNAAGTHTLPALAPLLFPGASSTVSLRLCTAARDGKGKLKLLIWDVSA